MCPKTHVLRFVVSVALTCNSTETGSMRARRKQGVTVRVYTSMQRDAKQVKGNGERATACMTESYSGGSAHLWHWSSRCDT
jgi:hypothetical protein